MASSSAGTTIALDVKASITIDSEVFHVQGHSAGVVGQSMSVTIDGEVFHLQGHSAGVVAQSMTAKTITLEVKASVTPASIQDTSEASPEPTRQRIDERIEPWMCLDDPSE